MDDVRSFMWVCVCVCGCVWTDFFVYSTNDFLGCEIACDFTKPGWSWWSGRTFSLINFLSSICSRLTKYSHTIEHARLLSECPRARKFESCRSRFFFFSGNLRGAPLKKSSKSKIWGGEEKDFFYYFELFRASQEKKLHVRLYWIYLDSNRHINT